MSSHELFHFQSLDELRRRIAELRLDLPVSDDASTLLDPVKLNGRTLANRFVVLPMEGCDGTPDGAPDELTFRRYRRFASGGAGLLWLEACAVVREGRANPRQLWINENNVSAFARLVEEAAGAARETFGAGRPPFLVLQLTHSGRYSKPVRGPQPIIAHRSPYLDPIHKLPPDYPVISDDELERLEDIYVQAAVCAKKAGFDAVDVKACHRYLVSELHASFTREGRYGGSFGNRTRFFRNVVAKIKDAVPGLVVTSRMNVYDAMAWPYGFGVNREDATKADLSEPIELIRFLVGMGAPLVNITIGNPYFNPHVNRPFDLPVAGAPMPPENPLEGVARFVGIVSQIQREFPKLAVIGGGYSWLRHFFPNVAAACVKNGWVSLVGAGRMSFAYPDFPRDLAAQGRLDGSKACVACSACTQIMRDGGRAGCVPRDAEVYEPIYKAGRAEALDTILAMAKTCRQCNDPTCIKGCPARVNIPKFVGQIAEGRFREAYETLRQANVLATVCGYVCPSETLCESVCINQYYTETVPIRHLQRWVSRKAVEEGWAAEPRPRAAATGKRIAVLGAGPAGISAATTLASLGHKVVLFDGAPAPGGTAGGTIPADRLPESILHREIDDVLSSSGDMERRYGLDLNAKYGLNEIRAEGFDAVLVALGVNRSTQLPGAARPNSGVTGSLEFLSEVKRGATVSGAVLVIGGGNTAIDAALSAKRFGASDVAVVYRRSFAEMPAWPNERDRAMEAGVHFLILTQPVAYATDQTGKLTGLRVVRTKLSDVGKDGRRTVRPIPGSEHTIPADLVIEAIGQQLSEEARSALAGLRLSDDGRVWTKSGKFETSLAGVYAAGDVVNGGTTVVQAIGEGARAAREMDGWLRGER